MIALGAGCQTGPELGAEDPGQVSLSWLLSPPKSQKGHRLPQYGVRQSATNGPPSGRSRKSEKPGPRITAATAVMTMFNTCESRRTLRESGKRIASQRAKPLPDGCAYQASKTNAGRYSHRTNECCGSRAEQAMLLATVMCGSSLQLLHGSLFLPSSADEAFRPQTGISRRPVIIPAFAARDDLQGKQ